MNEQPVGMSNLSLSSDTIYILPEKKSGQLVITNTHQNYSLLFKIKTSIEKVFDVKPVKGLLKPGERIVINFKNISNIDEETCIKYEKSLQFLVQAVNRQQGQFKKEEQEILWKTIKEKTANISQGYCACKIGVKFSAPKDTKQYIPTYTTFDSRLDNKFKSSIKTQSHSTLNQIQSNFRFSQQPKTQKDDVALSNRYQQLKRQHNQLERERQQILTVNKKTEKKNSDPKLIIIIVIIIVSFLLGNYLKGLLQPKPQPIKMENEGFFSFFG